MDQYGNSVKLYPNDYVEAKTVPARKEFVFPDDVWRSHGLKLRVRTPKDKSTAVESVVIIATKEEGHFLEDTALQNPTFTDIMKELAVLAEHDPAFFPVKFQISCPSNNI